MEEPLPDLASLQVSCPHAARCPGCPAISRPYGTQLELKQRRVQAALKPFPTLRWVDVPPLAKADPIVGYRTRAKFVADAQGALGLYASQTHEVIDVPECVVLEPLVAKVVAAVRAQQRVLAPLAGLDVVRVADGVLVTLIVDPARTEQQLAPWLDALREASLKVLGVAISRRTVDAVELLGTDLTVAWGAQSARRRLADDMPYYTIAHGGFVQNHDQTAASIQRAIVRALGELRGRRVLELYAGAGSLSLWLAQKGAMVTAVESFKPACERLDATSRGAGLGVTVVADDAGHAMATFVERKEAFDVVVINPPRRGVDPRVREGIAALGAQTVFYVSCEPATLARDLSHLAALGLSVQSVQPFDMIPLTDQVETLVHLTKTVRPSLVPAYEDARVRVIDKPSHIPMDMLGDRGSEPALNSLPKGHSGLVVFAKDPQTTAELGDAGGFPLMLTVLARGVTHARGTLGRGGDRLRYTRRQVIGGHSLLEVTCPASAKGLERAFLLAGHPIIGASQHADRRTNQHFLMRHGLDRAFVHVARAELTVRGEVISVEAPLAPDLTLVLESLSAL